MGRNVTAFEVLFLLPQSRQQYCQAGAKAFKRTHAKPAVRSAIPFSSSAVLSMAELTIAGEIVTGGTGFDSNKHSYAFLARLLFIY